VVQENYGNNMKRTSLFRRAGAALVAMAFYVAANAQDYPNRAVKIIVPFAPGGQPDIAVRVLAQQFSLQLGQPFLVENIPGASGIAALNAFLKTPPDGYTLSYGDAGHWAINKALNPDLPFDPQRDLAPIGLYGETTGLFLVVTESMPARTLQELVALVKSRPGGFSYASAGVGSIHHLIMEDFKASLGLDILHVPYKGSAQAVPALVGGQVSMAIASLAAVSPYAKDGRVRILGVSTKKRSSMAPNVPPMAEAGIPDFDHTDAVGLAARAGTARAIIDKLSAALAKTVAMPEVVARFAAVGLEPAGDTTPDGLAERIRQNQLKYARVVKISRATAD
jgi:tripartite-type tricarboxylate transporter receptor subunit TctC